MNKPAARRLTSEDYQKMDDIELAKHAHSRPWWQHTLARDEDKRRFNVWLENRNKTQENQICQPQLQSLTT